MDDSMMVGNAGEFYVRAELTRRGWTRAEPAGSGGLSGCVDTGGYTALR